MIIGITGVAGSGKTTVARFLEKSHGFVAVSLADQLKRLANEVFGFSKEQAWGPSSARNAPDMRYIRQKKGALGRLFYPNSLEGTEYEKYKDDLDDQHCLPNPPEDIYLTPRHAYQALGTEWGRACWEDVWISATLRIAKELLFTGALRRSHCTYSPEKGLTRHAQPQGPPLQGVVIPDVRFKNEMEAILAERGKLIRVKRGQGLQGLAGLHISEREQLDIPDAVFDVIIDNSATSLDELEQHVAVVVKKLRG